MNYIALFFTHSGAIKFNRALKSKNIKTETCPIPRKLSSNCGIGVKFSIEGCISDFISNDLEKIYAVINHDYDLVYQCE